MKTSSPRRSLRIAAVALAGALSLGAFAAPEHVHGSPGMTMHGGHGAHHGGIGRMLDRMLDGVDATEAQRTQIRQIAQSAQADLKAQREASRGLHEQAMQLFTQPKVDASAAESLRRQMLAQHDTASKRVMQAMLDASAVLTPEQRVQLGERMKQRREMTERHREERRRREGSAPRS